MTDRQVCKYGIVRRPLRLSAPPVLFAFISIAMVGIFALDSLGVSESSFAWITQYGAPVATAVGALIVILFSAVPKNGRCIHGSQLKLLNGLVLGALGGVLVAAVMAFATRSNVPFVAFGVAVGVVAILSMWWFRNPEKKNKKNKK